MGGAKQGLRPASVTIADVARTAGVSRTTVSDALNGRGRVQTDTRRRVLDAAQALGYRANPHARLLRGGRSGMLGVVSSVVADGSIDLLGVDYFVDVLAATATTAMTNGYAVVLLPPSADEAVVDTLRTDGVLLLDPVAGDALVGRLEAQGVPTASTGRVPDIPREASSWADNDLHVEVGNMLDLLERRGAKRIALVCNPPVRSYTVDTLTTYEAWMHARGQEPQVALTDRLASESTGYHAALRLFEGDEPPDAVYSPLDRLAVGAALAAQSCGLAIPEDVLIAAGSDNEATRSASPAITAMDLNARMIGQRAVELLLQRIEDPTRAHEQVLLPAVLHERASTRRG